MSRVVVHLMRHGEVHNPEGVLYGRLPGYRLSELGETMARKVASHLHGHGHDVTRVLASPLERAQQTAAPIAEAFGLLVGTEPRIIEAGNDFEGLRIAGDYAKLAHPRYWRRYVNPTRPSWGEPYRDQVRRVVAAVADARRAVAAAGGGEVVLVSHQLPIWVTRRFVEGQRLWHDPRSRQCSLASLTSLTFDGSRLVGVDYAEPAGDLLPVARDMVPADSGAAPAGAES